MLTSSYPPEEKTADKGGRTQIIKVRALVKPLDA